MHTYIRIYTRIYTRTRARKVIHLCTSSSTWLNTKHSNRLITLQPPIKQQRLRTVTISDNGRLNGGNGAPRMKRSGDMISRSFSAIINARCSYEPLSLSLSLFSSLLIRSPIWRLSTRSLAKREWSPWCTTGHHKSRAIIVSVFS